MRGSQGGGELRLVVRCATGSSLAVRAKPGWRVEDLTEAIAQHTGWPQSAQQLRCTRTGEEVRGLGTPLADLDLAQDDALDLRWSTLTLASCLHGRVSLAAGNATLEPGAPVSLRLSRDTRWRGRPELVALIDDEKRSACALTARPVPGSRVLELVPEPPLRAWAAYRLYVPSRALAREPAQPVVRVLSEPLDGLPARAEPLVGERCFFLRTHGHPIELTVVVPESVRDFCEQGEAITVRFPSGCRAVDALKNAVVAALTPAMRRAVAAERASAPADGAAASRDAAELSDIRRAARLAELRAKGRATAALEARRRAMGIKPAPKPSLRRRQQAAEAARASPTGSGPGSPSAGEQARAALRESELAAAARSAHAAAARRVVQPSHPVFRDRRLPSAADPPAGRPAGASVLPPVSSFRLTRLRDDLHSNVNTAADVLRLRTGDLILVEVPSFARFR